MCAPACKFQGSRRVWCTRVRLRLTRTDAVHGQHPTWEETQSSHGWPGRPEAGALTACRGLRVGQERPGGASWGRAGGHTVWSPTAWTPALGEAQSSGWSRGPEAGLCAQAAPPGTCHQLKAPRHDHNGAALERVTSCHCSPHITPRNSHLRCNETASGLRPSPSGPEAPEDPGLQLLSWSGDGCADRQAVCGPLTGTQAEDKEGRRAQAAWRAEAGRAAPEQPPDRAELLGNLPGPSWCLRRAGRGGRAPGRQGCQAAAGSEFWACPTCSGRKPTAARRIDTEQESRGSRSQSNEHLHNSCFKTQIKGEVKTY